MRSMRAGPVLAVALLLAAVACTGGRYGVVYNSTFTAGYDPRSLYAAMSRAPLLVESFGAPAAGQDREEVDRASVLALRRHGPPWLSPHYTASPVDAGDGPYRLSIAYGMPRAFDRQRVCAKAMDDAALDAARRETDSGSTRTVASLCRGERTLGIAEGSTGTATDIDSENFARFVGRLAREAMPRSNPVMDDDCIFRNCD